LLELSGQTFERPLVLLTNPAYRLQAEFVQKSWKEIGVPTIIEEMEGAALRSRISSGGARAWRASWVADYPDPENFAALFYSPNIPPAGPNYTRFFLPEYDSLYRLAVQNPRPELYERMEDLRAKHAPVIVLYYYRTVRLIQKGWDFPNHPLVLELEKVVKKHQN
jgi:peptide/nickel transport system substrate-binding protein